MGGQPALSALFFHSAVAERTGLDQRPAIKLVFGQGQRRGSAMASGTVVVSGEHDGVRFLKVDMAGTGLGDQLVQQLWPDAQRFWFGGGRLLRMAGS